MFNETDDHLTASFQFISLSLSMAISGMGCIVLTGWFFNIEILKSALPGLSPMTPNTALTFILTGAGLWLLQVRRATIRANILSRILAALVTAMGVATLIEYVTGINLGIDQLWFKKATDAAFAVFPGRMSPLSAVNFSLTGIALLTIDRAAERKTGVSQIIILFEGTLSLLSLIGYSYGTTSLYSVGFYKPIALHTAVVFLFVFFGVLFARPRAGLMTIITSSTESGIMARKMLLVIIGGVFLLGWLVLVGLLAGLYEAAFGFALLVISIIIVTTAIVWHVALSLHRMDINRISIERELESQKDFSFGLIQNSSAPTFVLDAGHRVILWNKACEDLTGIQASDVMNTAEHWRAFYGYKRPCLADIIIENALKDLPALYSVFGKSTILPEGWHGEGWFANLGGKKRYIVFDAAPVYNTRRELIASVETLQDLTEHKYAEEALMESEERYRELIQNIPVGMYRNTPGENGTFVMCNAALAKMFGYDSIEEFAKLKAGDLYENPRSMEDLQDRIAAAGKVLAAEVRFRKKDGAVFWGAVTARVERNPSGRPAYFDGMIEDISERKRVEQLKSDFVGLVSHQLKTPVAEIKGYIYNMLAGIAGELNPKQRIYLEEMQEISSKNYRLISDLLNVSRIERGVISLDVKPVPLSEIVDMALAEYYDLINKKGLVLRSESMDKDIVVMADRDKTIEALSNVINNAIKFTTQGSITIKAALAGAEAILEITDTGSGIEPDTLKILFTKEQTMHGAPVAGGGAGLGLYIAKSFMVLQKGDIAVRSTAGTGSTFTLTLPLATGEAQ